MSSEESLNSENDYRSNNRSRAKQRRPDMQVYVPRAKRIEDQVKHRMSAGLTVCSDTSGGDLKLGSSSSPSPEHRSGKACSPSVFRPTWEAKEESALKERMKPNDRKVNSQIQYSAGRKGPQPQPQGNKLPSQVIQEIMKRHKITVAASESTPEHPIQVSTMAQPTIKKVDEPLIQLHDPPMETSKVEGDSSILNCLPASYQDFIMEEIAFTTATANQRLASVQSASVVEAGQSPFAASISPIILETPDLAQLLQSCSGGRGSPCFDADDLEVKMINESFEEAQKQMQLLGSEAVKKAWNTFYTQDDPSAVVAMPTTAISSPKSMTTSTSGSSVVKFQCSSTSCATGIGVSKTRTSADRIADPVISIASASKSGDSGIAKLTWAGWGANPGEAKVEERSSSKTKTQKEHDYLFTATAAMSSTIPFGAHGHADSSKPTVSSVPSCSSASSSSVATSPHCQRRSEDENLSPAADIDRMDFNDTQEMDMLSAAMIEKVLSEDGDDFETIRGTLKSKSEAVGEEPVRNEAAGAKFSSSSLTGDKNLAAIWNRDENVDASGASSAAAADSWEELFDEPGEKLTARLMQQVKITQPKAKLERKEIDYFTLAPKESVVEKQELCHVVEAYGFPPSVKGEELYLALRQLRCPDFRIEWVDDTHALVIFANEFAAQSVLSGTHPVIKLRPFSKASTVSKTKATELKDLLQPYLRRPNTSAVLARRLVEGHLGKRSEIGADQRKREREKLQEAREQKKAAAQQRTDIWEGRL